MSAASSPTVELDKNDLARLVTLLHDLPGVSTSHLLPAGLSGSPAAVVAALCAAVDDLHDVVAAGEEAQRRLAAATETFDEYAARMRAAF